MHCFNLGFGGDLTSSSLIALCKLKVFPGPRKLQLKLDRAFELFETWRIANSKSCSTKSFDKTRIHKRLGTSIGSYIVCPYQKHAPCPVFCVQLKTCQGHSVSKGTSKGS